MTEHDVTEATPVEKPTVEELLTNTREQLLKEQEAKKEVQTKLDNMESAMQFINGKTAQLEANVNVLREQRDRFLEAEADASVNLELEKTYAKRRVAEIEKQARDVIEEAQPLRAKLNQCDAALKEVREKFGQAKSDQKKAEVRMEEVAQELRESQQALDWYIENTAGIRYSVPFRFFKATNTELTHEHIEVAYKRTLSKHRAVTSDNFVDFLVDANK